MQLNPNAMAALAAQRAPDQSQESPLQNSQGPVKLFVGQVPGVCTEEMLQPLFSGFGDVTEVSIMRDKTTNRSKGSAWVVYKERSAAETAIENLHDQHIIPPQTNPLQIKIANTPPIPPKDQSQNNPFFQQQQVILKQLAYLNKFGGHSHPSRGGRKLFVGQIPRSATQQQLTEVMAMYGPVEEVCILKDKSTGTNKGCAFVVYTEKGQAQMAIDGLHGKHVMPPMSNPMQVSFAEGELEEQEPKLFVGMVPYKSSEEDIRLVFAHYGEIAEVALLRGQNGQSRGCAFVKYQTMDSAKTAVQNLHGNFKMEGGTSALTVKFADSDKEKKKRQKLKQVLGQLQVLGTPGAPPGAPGAVPGVNPAAAAGQMPMGLGGMMGVPMPGMPFMPGMPGPGGIPMVPPMGMMGFNPKMGMPGMMPGMPMPGMPGVDMQGGAGAEKKASGPPGANIFILHLPTHWGNAELTGAFNPFGHIISATVYKDRVTNHSKGFGFVSYADPASAQQAISSMNGYLIPGHSQALKVQLKNTDKNPARGGAPGGHRGAPVAPTATSDLGISM